MTTNIPLKLFQVHVCGKPVLVSFRLNNDLLLNLILLPDDSCRNVISFIQMGTFM